MIDFQRKEFRVASTISLVAILTLLFTLLFLLFYPKPTTKGIASRFRKQDFRIQLDTQAMKKRKVEASELIDENTWVGGPETVGPSALTKLSTIAAKHKVKVTGFRPQRQANAETVNTLPFLVNLEGPFSNVVDATRDIESNGTRLGVSMVQVTSAEATTSKVSASVGIVAYLNPSAKGKKLDDAASKAKPTTKPKKADGSRATDTEPKGKVTKEKHA